MFVVVTLPPLPNPFYYLDNFRHVLGWIAERYEDLLDAQERAFIEGFQALPQATQALLVRMVMRKGALFRESRLAYPEIGDTWAAVQPLLTLQWVDPEPALALDALFGVLRKDELHACLREHGLRTGERKADWLARLSPLLSEPRLLGEWHAQLQDRVYALRVMPLCDRLRLLYFGNLSQEWSEFVLADLGIYRYETVAFSSGSRGIASRADIDTCLVLHECRQLLEQAPPLAELGARVMAIHSDNPWLALRRGKLLYQIGQQAERQQDWSLALALYGQSGYPGARLRRIRVLERCGAWANALALLQEAEQAPEDDAERQQLPRIAPRLQRKLGLRALPKRRPPAAQRIDVCLTPLPGFSVEHLTLLHLSEEGGEVHYVENALVNSLFGLLCWPAIFAPLPGAFFHPFHSAPVDLHSPDFHSRRAPLFESCLAALDDGSYSSVIRQRFAEKHGLQSPFVFWGALNDTLLDMALQCLPAVHLKHWFQRLLQNIKANRTGMPDLIQFYPAERRYRMIEVKGPGDRLQDNQLRWLAFCAEHGMPVEVCYVSWAPEAVVE